METPQEMLIKTIQEIMGYDREDAEKYAKHIVEAGKKILEEEK